MAKRRSRKGLKAIKAYRRASVVEALPFDEESMLRGMSCPECEQHVQLYVRKLSRTMVCALAWLVRRYQKNGNKWIVMNKAAPRWVVTAPQLSTTKHWGLVRRKANKDSTRRTSNTYKPTKRGIAFIEGRLSVPAEVFLYNDSLRARSIELVTVRDVVYQFDYGELMSRGIEILDGWRTR